MTTEFDSSTPPEDSFESSTDEREDRVHSKRRYVEQSNNVNEMLKNRPRPPASRRRPTRSNRRSRSSSSGSLKKCDSRNNNNRGFISPTSQPILSPEPRLFFPPPPPTETAPANVFRTGAYDNLQQHSIEPDYAELDDLVPHELQERRRLAAPTAAFPRPLPRLSKHPNVQDNFISTASAV